jgi:hypothetical protein
MPRYLLIEFDVDKQAEQFMAKVDAGTERGQPYRVRGLFAKPRRVCTCPGMDQPEKLRRGSLSRWAVGPKYGWFVHRGCGRAKPGTQWPFNLLRREQVDEVTGNWTNDAPRIRFHIDMTGHTQLQAVTLHERGMYDAE